MQAASARIAQLSAADAAVSAQLEEYRRRSTAQRAAAAQQLASLKAAAGSSGGGVGRLGSGSSSTAGGCVSSTAGGQVSQQQQQQQQQWRLSLPSEFGGSDHEGEVTAGEGQGAVNTAGQRGVEQEQGVWYTMGC